MLLRTQAIRDTEEHDITVVKLQPRYLGGFDDLAKSAKVHGAPRSSAGSSGGMCPVS
jgi:hypothetical protein